jgi:hypothetical protein
MKCLEWQTCDYHYRTGMIQWIWNHKRKPLRFRCSGVYPTIRQKASLGLEVPSPNSDIFRDYPKYGISIPVTWILSHLVQPPWPTTQYLLDKGRACYLHHPSVQMPLSCFLELPAYQPCLQHFSTTWKSQMDLSATSGYSDASKRGHHFYSDQLMLQ